MRVRESYSNFHSHLLKKSQSPQKFWGVFKKNIFILQIFYFSVLIVFNLSYLIIWLLIIHRGGNRQGAFTLNEIGAKSSKNFPHSEFLQLSKRALIENSSVLGGRTQIDFVHVNKDRRKG